MRHPSCAATIALVTLAATLSGPAAGAAGLGEEEAELASAGAMVVSIATGRQQALRVAPAAVTVITAADIEAMGATELDQALESVPGLHVSHFYQGYTSVYQFRGVAVGMNPQVLMLVNGLSINNAVIGNRAIMVGAYPLENVARIEVIRGPGSALYGANAFSGVINIVTKGPGEREGGEAGARAGSWRTREGWLRYDARLGPANGAIYLGASRSDGPANLIDTDLQAQLDPLFGTHVSRAPGPLYLAQSGSNLGADLAWSDWRLRANYQQRKSGFGPGIAESLEPPTRLATSRLGVDLGYQKANVAPDWDVSATLEYFQIEQRSSDHLPQIFPPGAFGGLFPDGVIGNPTWYERNSGVSVSAQYGGLAHQHLLVGAGYRREDVYKVAEQKNFMFNPVPGALPALLPLPEGLIQAENDPARVWLLPAKRNITYVYLQDEWNFLPDWTLTAGLRRDRYSDVGGSTNPRLALVWDAAYNLVVKALYGRAFRAPSFIEQYPGVNPTVRGNPQIRPERMATSELVLAWQPQADWQSSLTLFHYHESAVIEFVANAQGTGSTAQNTGDRSGRGLEFELGWQATRALRLKANYSVQRSADGAGRDAGLAPHRHGYARADWHADADWQGGVAVNYVAGRLRQPGDARAPVPDYATVDLNLRRDKLWRAWELRLALRNLFDRDAREPSEAPGNIPHDLPLPGRNISVQLQTVF